MNTELPPTAPRRSSYLLLFICLGTAGLLLGLMFQKPSQAGPIAAPAKPPLSWFVGLMDTDPEAVTAALKTIEAEWQPSFAVMLLEAARVRRGDMPNEPIYALLNRVTGQSLSNDTERWFPWVWEQNIKPHPQYPEFKAWVYSHLDRRFAEHFASDREAAIRLEEVRWGGVRRDGIPPLDHPDVISSDQASWLEDDHVVFGVEFNGQARCYPKRILAWHEMVRDSVGGQEINGVYCTLCGSMVVYNPILNDTHHVLGTSGFLYRSNKLMYDQSTKSLWSTLTGRPVIGPLVNKDIKLERLPVVTSTWGEWRRRHPQTGVLSLQTGHRRDYDEGVAYQEYFSNDKLMFVVPNPDARLADKQSVLALRTNDSPGEQLALDTAFLKDHPVLHETLGDQSLVILTDPSGASRVYECGDIRFRQLQANGEIRDNHDRIWTITETHLTANDGRQLPRVSAHEAFWFGWVSQFPQTRLISAKATEPNPPAE